MKKYLALFGLAILACLLSGCQPILNTDYPEPIPETALQVIGKYQIKEIKARYGSEKYPQPMVAAFVYVVYESENQVGMVARIHNLYTGDRLAYFMKTIELTVSGDNEITINQFGRRVGLYNNGKLEFAGTDDDGFSIKISGDKT